MASGVDPIVSAGSAFSLGSGVVVFGSNDAAVAGSLALINQSVAGNFTASGVAGQSPTGDTVVSSGGSLATPH